MAGLNICFFSKIGHSLLVGLLFSTLDTSIVATSLVTISHDLDDFVNAPWIVLAYLLTYMSRCFLQSTVFFYIITNIAKVLLFVSQS